VYDLDCKLGKGGAHAWMKDYGSRGGERGNKLCLCLLYMKVLCKIQNKWANKSPNGGTSTWVASDSLSPGRAFMICSCLLSGVKRQTQNLGDSNSSLRFAAYWSHGLRHILKSVTSASSPENDPYTPFSGSLHIWVVRHSMAEQRTWI